MDKSQCENPTYAYSEYENSKYACVSNVRILNLLMERGFFSTEGGSFRQLYIGHAETLPQKKNQMHPNRKSSTESFEKVNEYVEISSISRHTTTRQRIIPFTNFKFLITRIYFITRCNRPKSI